MQRFAFTFIVALLAVSSLWAEEKPRPPLHVSCIANQMSYTPADTVTLTVTLENVGASDFYIHRHVEWGWAGIGFKLLDATEHIVRPRKGSVPLPPPPLNDKSDLVGLSPGYFFGTNLEFELSHYDLRPGSYYIEVSYRSNYREDDGFGLPVLTSADGEFLSNRVRIVVRPN